MKVIELDVFNRNGDFLGKKRFYDVNKTINQWLKVYGKKINGAPVGLLDTRGNDFQNQRFVCIKHQNQVIQVHSTGIYFSQDNLIPIAIYFSVRHAIPASWLNDRDQFLYPNDLWQQDSNFQNDCLAFMLFHSQNKIRSQEGINHFIPFSESEVGVTKEPFSSHFMYEFINGKIKPDFPCDTQSSPCHSTQSEKSPKESKRCFANAQHDKSSKKGQTSIENETFYTIRIPTKPLSFSNETSAVFSAGRELWRYYHSQDFNDPAKPYNVNASLYDIKAYFQGYNDKGKMNAPQKAQDEHYKKLIGELNAALSELAKEIEPKIYKYGFLLQ